MRTLLILAVSALALIGQDVGMGRRRATGARLETPYTLDIETAHVKWAKPLRGGPIRLFAVPTVSEGRTLVELAQRLSLDLTTVSIDPAWDVNKWTMAFGPDYGARAEKDDLSLLYSYVEAELTGPKQFDAILLPIHHGWERLTPASREALARRVTQGAGLVLIRPMDHELSPLRPTAAVAPPADGDAIVQPGTPEKAASWKRAAAHYITESVPVESFPFAHVAHYRYRAAPDAQILAATDTGDPIIAVRQHGKGRVIAFAYQNVGLSWNIPMSARGSVAPEHWEGLYALLCRSLVYAAHREDDAPGAWRIPQPPARTSDIQELKATPDLISEGASVSVTWRGSTSLSVELVDGFNRVIARATGAGQATLRAGRPLTHSGFLVAGGEKLPVRFASSEREWNDYEVIMPWYGPRSHQPWMAAVDEQFRRVGITTLSSPERNFRIIASAGLHDVFGVYAYRRANYAKRKEAYLATGDKKYLTRDVVLQSPEFEPNLRTELKARVGSIAPLKPLAYYLADESSLTSYTDPFDVDWAPAALAGFREWLRREYRSLEALNTGWGTSFRDWESVVPMTTEEAQKHGNFAPWADHRAYMEHAFVAAIGTARKIVREIDPAAPASISGTQVPTAHNGANWYEIDQIIDYLQPYSGGNQDAMHHLFRPGILLTGFTGYGLTGADAEYQQWQRLFYGHTGASIFWHYTILNPDLTLSAQGEALAHAFGRIQSGIGRMFMNSRVHEDAIAIHFSMPSIRGAWITDGKIQARVGNVNASSKNYADLVRRRDAWVKQLEKQGLQFRFLATPQIENGELDRYKVLILPYSIALSDREIAAIERFLDRGGSVYADEQTGRMDEHCRWRREPLWTTARPTLFRGEPREINVQPAFRPLEGDFLVTVRDFGSSRLIGALTRDGRTVSLPATQRVRYDLLRSAPAADRVETSAIAPILLLERNTRIAKLELTPGLDLRLTDERGAPVDRSVVRVEIFDPAGKLVRHYTGNRTIRDGTARFEIPFAMNDAPGTWQVRARDVISGLTAERTLRRP
jgi:hypothetical protein